MENPGDMKDHILLGFRSPGKGKATNKRGGGWREEWDRLSSGVMKVLEPGGPRLYNVLNPLSGTL